MRKFAPHAAKVRLYHVSTGEQVERWSVDARVLIESGEYTTDPPEGDGPAVTVNPAPEVSDDDAQQMLPQPPAEYAEGVPLQVTHAAEAAPAAPAAAPVRRGRR